MSSEDIIELASITSIAEHPDPPATVRHIPIVQLTRREPKIQVVFIPYPAEDDLPTAQLMQDKFRAGFWERLLKLAMFKKEGFYAGTVRKDMAALDRSSNVANHHVQVQVVTIEADPRKDLERALQNPSMDIDWSPYATTLTNESIAPHTMRVLIIKWRPTRQRTKQALETAGTWLARIGIAVGIWETHGAVVGAGI